MSTATSSKPRGIPALVRAAKRLAESIATPLVPADYLDLVAPLRQSAELRGRVVSVTPETRSAATVTIRPGRSWRGHRPGQYIRIGIDVDGVRHWRAYSVTSEAAARDGLISITVKAIAEGKVSNHIVRLLEPGTLVHLDQATGDFVLPSPAPARTLFLTAGSGITPVIGMLRNHLEELPDIVVVHSSPTPDEMLFADQLRAWQRTGRLRFVERHTETDGIITPGQLDTLVPDWRLRESWACGPVGMLDVMELHWAEAGLEQQLHTERFRTALLVEGEGGTVTFARQGAVVQADGATPILDAGEAAGVLMPSGCRMGICFGCVVPLQSGIVRDLRDGQLTVAAPGDDIRIQTCVSAAAGNCAIDL